MLHCGGLHTLKHLPFSLLYALYQCQTILLPYRYPLLMAPIITLLQHTMHVTVEFCRSTTQTYQSLPTPLGNRLDLSQTAYTATDSDTV